MRVTLFIPSYGDGGVERDFVNTARGLSDRGVEVDFVTSHSNLPYLNALPDEVTLITLGGDAREEDSFLAFVEYLRARRPDVLMSGKDKAHETALAGRRQSGIAVQLIMRPGTIMSAKHRPSRFWRTLRAYRYMRRIYPQADLLVAVSRGVAMDAAHITGVEEKRIEVIRSPVITPRIYAQASESVSHPWIVNKTCPVLVAIGRLVRVKGFEYLLRAFAQAHQSRDLRLIIIGQGRKRASLEKLARRLEIRRSVDFVGFLENPYPLLASADLFLLSSLVEGLGNVVVEALALGRRVVATDCPTGPREILGSSCYGTLVPVADPRAMAEAMISSLHQPQPDRDKLRAAVEEYTLETSAARYQAAMERLAHQAQASAS